MADNTPTTQMVLTGRKVITTNVKEITGANVLDVVSTAVNNFAQNNNEIDYLYRYRRGDQPILERTKEIRKDICSKIVENRADEIVSFKTGYLVGEPVKYVQSSAEDDRANVKPSSNILRLNSFMSVIEKSASDIDIADWMYTCGTALRFVTQNEKYDPTDEDSAPFELITVDPRNAFVLYSADIKRKPMAGIFITKDEEGATIYSVYTENKFYVITSDNTVYEEDYPFGMIPLIEYIANDMRLGVFETVIPLLDAINNFDSDRLDGVEQFIQALCVATNCEFPEKENGDPVTADDIRQAGMIVLKSNGENKAEFKILSEPFDQAQNQTFKDDMIRSVYTIVGMPAQGDGNSSDSSNNGAVILKNGWYAAESRAKKNEILFKRSEKQMLKVVKRICKDLTDFEFNIKDIDIKFTRRNYEDIASKSQVLISMLGNNKIDPLDAFISCGLFADPEEAYWRGQEYLKTQAAAGGNNGGNDGNGNGGDSSGNQ